MAEETKLKARTRVRRHVFVDTDGRILALGKEYKKPYKEALRAHLGTSSAEKFDYTLLDLNDPLRGVPLQPGPASPICKACGLCEMGSLNPYMPYRGSTKPLITFVVDSVSRGDDGYGELLADGHNKLVRLWARDYCKELGISLADVRFIATTRCANRTNLPVNYKTKGNHCRIFAIQDLMLHPPRIIVPVGSVALGLLSHKSNAQDWGGKLLTWRGWPDDWLCDPLLVKPKLIPANKKKENVEALGHPLFGSPPGASRRRLMLPIQAPRIVASFQNEVLMKRWNKQIRRALILARDGVKAPCYDLPHYRLLKDRAAVEEALYEIIDRPGLDVTYDTETEGLHPFHGQKIVFMMFRYVNPDTGQPVAVGWPWDYDEDPILGPASPLLPHVRDLSPLVDAALQGSNLVGHNTAFDALFSYKNLTPPSDCMPIGEDGLIRPEWRQAMARLNGIADAFKYDTWHMAYTRLQQRGSLGLEVVTYDFAPDLAGYEEDFTLLIELERQRLHPEEGGHYARCPEDKWDSHLKTYVLGDVEACARCKDTLAEKLAGSAVYKFPLARPGKLGSFSYFTPPNRDWLYHKIMSPANALLTKVMGRGMAIDMKALEFLELHMPKAINGIVERMKGIGGNIVQDYIKEMEATDAHRDDPDKRWEFDLEKKDQMREVLFHRLRLKIQRLTKKGRALYGEDPENWNANIAEALLRANPARNVDELESDTFAELLNYAALDKFTLNKLAVTYPDIRPLQDYRKVHKLYGTYVRPLRNAMDKTVDKKPRSGLPHLCSDGCIHAQFMLTGTRGGRLSCRNPNLQQLPKEGFKDGMVELQVKRMYKSRFGRIGCLYAADFSQIELRLLAAASGDPTMVKAYFDGTDLHSLTTSKIFDTPYDHFSKDHMTWLEQNGRDAQAKDLKLKRDIGKTVNFLTGYGGGGFGLQTVLANRGVYKELDWCEDLVAAFFDAYPAVKDLLSYYKRFIYDNQVAVSIFGRVRVFMEVLSNDREAASKALRAGCNHLIQSTASDMMLVGLVAIEQLMREAGLDSILVSTVHDSLVIDAVREELPQIHEICDMVLNNMPSVFKAMLGDDYDTSWMQVPFSMDADVGYNYGDMRRVPTEKKPYDIDFDSILDGKRN